jgi:hypothetical protein
MKPTAILFASAVALATYALNANSSAGLPSDWAVGGEAPHLYVAEVDSADNPSGTGSLVLRRTETSHPYASAVLARRLPVQTYAGKQVRLSMLVRGEAPEHVVASVYVGHGKSSHMAGINSNKMKTWTWVKSVITLPHDLEEINVGVGLKGPGLVKVAELKTEVVGDAPPDQKGISIRTEKEEDGR